MRSHMEMCDFVTNGRVVEVYVELIDRGVVDVYMYKLYYSKNYYIKVAQEKLPEQIVMISLFADNEQKLDFIGHVENIS